MATRDIGRSTVEGGRNGYNKWERRASHRHERARFRAWQSHLQDDPDEVYAASSPRERNRVGKGFTDKLGPIYRWIQSRVGEPWDAVYSELCSKFDARGLAGYHVLYGHVLPQVAGAGGPFSYGPSTWMVDDRGILQAVDGGYNRPRYGARWRRPGHGQGPTREDLVNWLAGRRVIDYGTKLFWGVPTLAKWVRCTKAYWRSKAGTYTYSCLWPDSWHEMRRNPDLDRRDTLPKRFWWRLEQPKLVPMHSEPAHVRQGVALSDSDQVFYRSLNPYQRANVALWRGKGKPPWPVGL